MNMFDSLYNGYNFLRSASNNCSVISKPRILETAMTVQSEFPQCTLHLHASGKALVALRVGTAMRATKP